MENSTNPFGPWFGALVICAYIIMHIVWLLTMVLHYGELPHLNKPGCKNYGEYVMVNISIVINSLIFDTGCLLQR